MRIGCWKKLRFERLQSNRAAPQTVTSKKNEETHLGNRCGWWILIARNEIRPNNGAADHANESPSSPTSFHSSYTIDQQYDSHNQPNKSDWRPFGLTNCFYVKSPIRRLQTIGFDSKQAFPNLEETPRKRPIGKNEIIGLSDTNTETCTRIDGVRMLDFFL